MEEKSRLSSLLSFVLKWGNCFRCCIFPHQKLDRVSRKRACTGELVLRQARTEPQGRHREADADISSKRNLLWPLRDHLLSSSTVFPQDLYSWLTPQSPRCSTMWSQTRVPFPAIACHCWFDIQSCDSAWIWWTHIHLSTQQSLVIDEPVLFWSTSGEMLQERTWHVSLRHRQWLCGPS